MKNFITVLFLIFSIYFYSCGQKNDKTQGSGSTTKDTTMKIQTQQPPSGETPKTNVEKLEQSKTSEGIRVKFPVGSTQVTLNGNIDGFGQQITYVFEASKGQKLNASVRPKKSQGNIRISQIYIPSGQADGPFGEKMAYDLTENGDYRLILSENQMAGDPWKGEYLLTIEIK